MAASQPGTKRAASAANKKIAASMLAAGMSHTEVAQSMGVPVTRVRRWACAPEVKADVQRVVADARRIGEDEVASLVRGAFGALRASLEADDARVRLDAAKTTLDRFGFAASTKAEVTGANGAPVGGPPVVVAYEVLRAVAAEEDDA